MENSLSASSTRTNEGPIAETVVRATSIINANKFEQWTELETTGG